MRKWKEAIPDASDNAPRTTSNMTTTSRNLNFHNATASKRSVVSQVKDIRFLEMKSMLFEISPSQHHEGAQFRVKQALKNICS